ncbi:hypothetical protein TWF718_005737 [Orbilia javanica]|uniref:Uncharacterized protein n=1 Tax=Orbilia javanica TaxID=47235 RepID=A0AAN8MZE6_9PEZI
MLFGEQYKSLWKELEAEREYTKNLEQEIARMAELNKAQRGKNKVLQDDIHILANRLEVLLEPERERYLGRIAELEVRIQVLENENERLGKLAGRSYVSFPRPSFSGDVEELGTVAAASGA